MSHLSVELPGIGYVLTVAGLLAFTKGLWDLGDRIEKGVSADARKDATRILRSIEGAAFLSAMASTFGHALDAVFGKRHLTWSCFRRSALASTITGIAVFATVAAFGRIGFDVNARAFLFVVVLAAMFNWVPDYLSLFKSRYLISRMALASGRWVIGLIVIDWLASAAIAMLAGLATLFIFGIGQDDWMRGALDSVSSGDFFERLVIPDDRSFLFIPDPVSILPVVFYTTFMTSIWAGLYAISVFLVRLISPVTRWLRRLKWLLDLDQPFASIVNVIAVVLWAVAVPAMLFLALR